MDWGDFDWDALAAFAKKHGTAAAKAFILRKAKKGAGTAYNYAQGEISNRLKRPDYHVGSRVSESGGIRPVEGGESDAFLSQLTRQAKGTKRSKNVVGQGGAFALPDVDHSSKQLALYNPQQSAQVQGGNNMEVPVIPPPKKLSKIFPDYFTVSLPYVQRLSTSTEASFTYDQARPFAVIRLNSIYDPLKEVNATVAGTSDDPLVESDLQPHGRHLWDSHFKYYRVIKTYVKLTFMSNRHMDYSENDRLWNEHYVVGYELVDEDSAVSNHVDMFLMTKHAKRAILKPVTKAVTFKSGAVTPAEEGDIAFEYPNGMSTVTLTYEYVPEKWNMHVEEAGQEERWTPILQNPSIDHDMAIRIMHMDTQDPSAQAEAVGVMVQVSYDVQFREATDSYFKTLNTDTATYGGAGEDAADD